MHKWLATLTLGIMLAVPLIATAAGAERTPGSLPAAVDQMLAQDMIQLAQTNLKIAGFDPGRVDKEPAMKSPHRAAFLTLPSLLHFRISAQLLMAVSRFAISLG